MIPRAGSSVRPRFLLPLVMAVMAAFAQDTAGQTRVGQPVSADAIPVATLEEVYVAALRFYRQPRGRVLWIDAFDLHGDSLDATVITTLLQRLDRAHFWEGRAQVWKGRADRNGGVVRVSRPQPMDNGYRMVVRYRYVTEAFMGPAIDQWLVLRMHDGEWQISSHGAVDEIP